MDRCAQLAATGLDSSLSALLAILALALIIGGALFARRTKERPGALTVVAIAALLACGLSTLGATAPAQAAQSSPECATPMPTPDVTPIPTSTPTSTPTPDPLGEILVTWDAATASCANPNENPNFLYLVNDASETVLWSSPMQSSGGTHTETGLALPGTYRVAVSNTVHAQYPADGDFGAPASFAPCPTEGLTTTYSPTDTSPASLTAAAPNATIAAQLDSVDTCPPSDKNGVVDTDGDGITDACDLDSDNDGIPDRTENTNQSLYFEDDDAEGNVLISGVLGDGIANYRDLDSDNDGLLDLFESGIPNSVIAQVDTDRNGIIDPGVSVGTNGIADILETQPDSGVVNYALRDTDADSMPDYLDLSSDEINYDLYSLSNGEILDPLGGGFIARTSDDDADGIMTPVDTNVAVRGAPGSQLSPFGTP